MTEHQNQNNCYLLDWTTFRQSCVCGRMLRQVLDFDLESWATFTLHSICKFHAQPCTLNVSCAKPFEQFTKDCDWMQGLPRTQQEKETYQLFNLQRQKGQKPTTKRHQTALASTTWSFWASTAASDVPDPMRKDEQQSALASSCDSILTLISAQSMPIYSSRIKVDCRWRYSKCQVITWSNHHVIWKWGNTATLSENLIQVSGTELAVRRPWIGGAFTRGATVPWRKEHGNRAKFN